MTKTQAPTWEERNTVTVLRPGGTPFTYNLERVSPTTWRDLRKTDFGSFAFPASSELVPLVHVAAHPDNRNSKNAQKVTGRWLAGNTLVLLSRNGLYGVDIPTVRGWRIYMGEKTLQSKLGSREDKGVTFSNDGRVRFTPDDFKTGEMTSSQLALNRAIAVAYNGFANAELLARAASHYRSRPYFGFSKEAPEKPIIKVPGVCANDYLDWLIVGCNIGPDYDCRYSFGVSGDRD